MTISTLTPLVELICWTIIHSLWQLAIVGLLVFAINRYIITRATSRYWIASIGLFACLGLPLLTISYFIQSGVPHPNGNVAGHVGGAHEAAVPAAFSNIENQPAASPRSATTHTPDSAVAATAALGLTEKQTTVFCFWVSGVWILGVVVLSIRYVMGFIQVNRLRHDSTICHVAKVNFCFRTLVDRFQFSKSPLLKLSDHINVPSVLGYFKPVVLLPACMVAELSMRELEAILAHELAHIRRRDFLINHIQVFIETILFFHPVVWWLSHQMRVSREYCCDDVALQMGLDRLTLAKALHQMEQLRINKELVLAASGGSLVNRIRRLNGSSSNPRTPVLPGLLTLVAVAVAAMIFSIAPTETSAENPDAAPALKLNDDEPAQDQLKIIQIGKLRFEQQKAKNKQTFEIYAQKKGRSPAVVIRKMGRAQKHFGHYDPSFFAHGWMTDMESIVSSVPSQVKGNTLKAKSVNFNLPEGSQMTARFSSPKVLIDSASTEKEAIAKVVIEDQLELIGPNGTVRAIAKPAGRGEKLEIECRHVGGEVEMKIATDRKNSLVYVEMFPEKGAPKNEKDPPHGAIRFEIFPVDEKDDKPLRMKIKWRYEMKQLVKDAEKQAGKKLDAIIDDDEEPKPLPDDKPTARPNTPWTVTGKVTDVKGNPLSGVEIVAHCGMGTLRRTGQTVTGASGSYELSFGPGIFSKSKDFVQVAVITARLAGHSEKNMNRQGNLLAALEKPAQLAWGTTDQLVLPNKAMTLDFVMQPATKLSGRVTRNGKSAEGYTIALTGPDLPPASNVLTSTQVNELGEFSLANIPTDIPFQILIRPKRRGTPWFAWASPPLLFQRSEKDVASFKYVNLDKQIDFACQQFEIKLEGVGANWRDALKLAADEPVKLNFMEALSTIDDSMVRAGLAWMELSHPARQ